MADLFSNYAVTTLNGAINDSTTSVTVASAAAFPSTGDFRIIIDREIMKVTSVSGSIFTVVRAAEPFNGVTAAAAHNNGAVVALIITNDGLRNHNHETLLVTGDAFFGRDATPENATEQGRLIIADTLAQGELKTDLNTGLWVVHYINNTSTYSGSFSGVDITAATPEAQSGNITGQLLGVAGAAVHRGTGTVDEAVGVAGNVWIDGPVTSAYGLWALNATYIASTLTNCFGVKVESQTTGSTKNVGIEIDWPGIRDGVGGPNVLHGIELPSQSVSLGNQIATTNAFAGISIYQPTLTSSTATRTVTAAYALYIQGPPIAGTNVSITFPVALSIESGLIFFGGSLIMGTDGAIITNILTGTTTWNPGNLTNGSSESATVTVTGAAAGDVAIVSLSTITNDQWELSGFVTSANTVTASLTNHTGDTIDLGSGTLRAVVIKIA